jgi:insulysin
MLNAELYNINSAHYGHNIELSAFQLRFSIYGPYNKIKEVARLYIDNLINLKISRPIFNLVKTNRIKSLLDYKLLNPIDKLPNILLDNIQYNYSTPEEEVNILTNIKYNNKNLFASRDFIFTNYKIICSISGNILLDDALDLAQTISLFTNKYQAPELNEFNKNQDNKITLIKPIKLGTKTHLTMISDSSKPNNNSAIGIYFKIQFMKFTKNNQSWIKLYCINNLVHSILDQEYYQQLRTNEQLGYLVNSPSMFLGNPYNRLLVYGFTIQSDVKPSNYLLDRTYAFIYSAQTILQNETDKTLQNRIQSIITTLKIQPNSLFEFVSKTNFSIFFSQLPNIYELIIDAYERITLKELINFYKKYLLNNNTASAWTVAIN